MSINQIRHLEGKFKATHGEGLKVLSPKQMLQRFPTTLAQAKAGNACENLLNEICQLIYSSYQPK